MKHIKIYINEKLHVTTKSFYTCQPKTKDELRDIIIQRIKSDGPECDLNDIDVSKITDMEGLFDIDYSGSFKKFNGDISQWDVSNVKNMRSMFNGCTKFNCNISHWDVSNVTNMTSMFWNCEEFNCDLSGWDVSNVNFTSGMFCNCKKFNCDLSRWNVSNVKDMYYMFNGCKNFRQNIDGWDVSNVEDMGDAFWNCPTIPKWYKE